MLAQLAEKWGCRPSDWFPQLPWASKLQIDAVCAVRLEQWKKESEDMQKGIVYL